MYVKALLRLSLLMSLALGPLSGCKDDDDDSDDAAETDEAVEHDHATCGLQENCSDDAAELEPGLKVEGEHFTVELTEAEWVDVSTDDVHWMAKITDSDGDAVDDATLFVDVFSIDCMHGGHKAGEEVTADDNGMYMLMPPFVHGGPWDLELTVTRGEVKEELKVEFCVPKGEGDDEVDHSAHEHLEGEDDADADHSEHTDDVDAGHSEHMDDEE